MNTLFQGNTRTGKDEWLTPPDLLRALGHFDLDPCAPVKRPWDTADNHFTIEDDGLKQAWFGRVFCNPPYGEAAGKFLAKCADHGNAIGLVFARLETNWFFQNVWSRADAILFIKGRLSFYHADGVKGGPAGCGSVLLAYGKANADALRQSGIPGKYLSLFPCADDLL